MSDISWSLPQPKNPSLYFLFLVHLQRRVREWLWWVPGTTTRGELQDIEKYVSHQPGESHVTWLLPGWDIMSHSMKLDGSEAKELGSLSQDPGIKKGD